MKNVKIDKENIHSGRISLKIRIYKKCKICNGISGN